MKKNMAVFFGGRTVEHDVSIITGNQIIENADKEKYNVIPVYISRTGEWFCGEPLTDTQYYRSFDPNDRKLTRVYLEPYPGRELKYVTKFGTKVYAGIDVAMLAMHGLHGEDGTLQGLMELADIPYSSAGVTGSAVGMDKIVMKCAFRGAGLPVLPAVYFERSAYEADPQKAVQKTEEEIGYPVFVKPANLGSSIGISKANNAQELQNAFEVAFSYDRRVLAERAVENLTEINSAVLGYGGDVRVSLLEQPISWKGFLNFEEKYLRSEGASKGMKSLARQIPAPIEKQQTDAIVEMSKKVFTTLDLKGVVRIDYIIDKDINEIYVNEVNTIPGSFAYYLYEPMGISFRQLIDECVTFAEAQMRDKNQNSYAFDSNILDKMKQGGLKGIKK
ncbi:MAG: D-alanine--D-alanine ligase family protein [Christensenella sp.]|nr:D-alanine--D-alanine ligase family protein [Christensenella sp.]